MSTGLSGAPPQTLEEALNAPENFVSLPTGTVTFLFTDIEGSSRLWEEHPDIMRIALARHDDLIRHSFEKHGGHIFKTIGDAFCAAFSNAPESVAAVVAAQLALMA